MTDAGKEILFYERREQRSKSSLIVMTDDRGFVVLKEEPKIPGVIELSNIKYFGIIDPKSINDKCGCRSFYHGNVEKWIAEHGTAFQCKHIIGAKKIRYG